MDYTSIESASILFFELIGSKQDLHVPYALELRNQNTLWFAMIGLSISFVLLSFSKLASSGIVVVYSRILLKNSSVEKIVREEFSLTSFSSLILILNFIITTTVLMYLTYLHFNTTHSFELFYIFSCIPLYFFLWPMLCLNVVGFLTKENALFKADKLNNVLISQIIGILFSLLLLIWAFNIKWSVYFIYTFIFIMVAFWIFKVLRGILFSLEKGVAWYYIFLYFCTLEILPLVLFYSLYYSKVKSFWLFV